MNRGPSNGEPSRLAAEHIERLRALRDALAELDALPPATVAQQRAQYVLHIARVLDAARQLTREDATADI